MNWWKKLFARKAYDFEPFGNLGVISAGHDILLQRLCYCMLSTDPKDAAAGHAISEVSVFLEQINPPPAGRIRWWRVTRGDYVSYVCVDPDGPGYRNTPPDDPKAIIEDLPADVGHDILPRIALKCLEHREKLATNTEAGIVRILAGARSAATRGKPRDHEGFVKMMTAHSRAMQHGRYKSDKEAQRGVNALFDEGLYGAATDCTFFSACITLYEMQARSNGWIQEDAYGEPYDFLRTLIREGHVPEATVAEVGAHHFKAGRDTIGSALNEGCLWRFQEKIYHALHHFWAAQMVALHARGKLPYSPMVAEEAFACTNTGLACGLTLFFSRSFIEVADELAAEFAREGAPALQSFLHHNCSTFFPVMPRPFARFFTAYAETLHSGKTAAQELLAPLYAADKGAPGVHPAGMVFNSFVRDYLLLHVCKNRGLEKEKEPFGLAIAARLMMDRALFGAK